VFKDAKTDGTRTITLAEIVDRHGLGMDDKMKRNTTDLICARRLSSAPITPTELTGAERFAQPRPGQSAHFEPFAQVWHG
jgi:hypothetical protein